MLHPIVGGNGREVTSHFAPKRRGTNAKAAKCASRNPPSTPLDSLLGHLPSLPATALTALAGSAVSACRAVWPSSSCPGKHHPSLQPHAVDDATLCIQCATVCI